MKKKTVISDETLSGQNKIYIIKCGNCTPVGTRAGMTATSVRVGFAGFALCSEFEDDSWEPVRCGVADYLDKHISHLDQFRELALPAMKEALIPLQELELSPINPIKIPVIIGLPEDRPGLPTDLEGEIGRLFYETSLRARLSFMFEFIHQGHTSLEIGDRNRGTAYLFPAQSK